MDVGNGWLFGSIAGVISSWRISCQTMRRSGALDEGEFRLALVKLLELTNAEAQAVFRSAILDRHCVLRSRPSFFLQMHSLLLNHSWSCASLLSVPHPSGSSTTTAAESSTSRPVPALSPIHALLTCGTPLPVFMQTVCLLSADSRVACPLVSQRQSMPFSQPCSIKHRSHAHHDVTQEFLQELREKPVHAEVPDANWAAEDDGWQWATPEQGPSNKEENGA